MLRIEKNWKQKSNFLNFLCREPKKIALGKEIFGECFFLCRELFVWLSAQKLPRGKQKAPGKAFFAESFLFALGTEPDSRQRLKFR
jgi:hypothetical protein